MSNPDIVSHFILLSRLNSQYDQSTMIIVSSSLSDILCDGTVFYPYYRVQQQTLENRYGTSVCTPQDFSTQANLGLVPVSVVGSLAIT